MGRKEKSLSEASNLYKMSLRSGSGQGASLSCEWGKSEGLKKETVMKGMFKED